MPSCEIYLWVLASSYYRLFCDACHKDCIECSGPTAEDCIICNYPRPFLQSGICVEKCEPDLYYPNFQNFTCIESDFYNEAMISSIPECQKGSIYSKYNLQIKINVIGSPTPSLFGSNNYLQVSVNNSRGSVNMIKLTQMAPDPSHKGGLMNIFVSQGKLQSSSLSKILTFKLHTSTLEQFPDETFVIRAETSNTCGDKAVSYLNLRNAATPTIGDMKISCPSSPCKVQEQFKIKLTGNWHDGDPTIMRLYIRILFELPDRRKIFGHISEYRKEEFEFKLPILSFKSDNNLPVHVLVEATSIVHASKILNKTIIVNNTFDGEMRSLLFKDLSIKNPVLSPLFQPARAGTECVYDSDCSHSSKCMPFGTGSFCQCIQGYSGIDCTIPSYEFALLSMKQGKCTNIHTAFKKVNCTCIKDRTAFEDTFLIWADYLIRPELVSFQMLDLANKVLDSSSDMSDKVVFSLSERFTVSYIEALSGFVKAIQYHYSNRFWKGSDELKIYFDENQKEQLLQTYEQTILVVNEYLRKISYKIGKGDPVLRLENDIAVFMIQYIDIGRMKNGDSSLDIGKDFSVTIDERFLEKSDACENLEEVKMLSIAWKIFPLKRTLSDEPDMFLKMISISFINMDLTPVQNMCNAYKIAYFSNPKPTNPSFLNCTESFSSSFSTSKIIQKCNIIQPPTLSIDSNPLQTPPKSKPTPSQSI
ncbi:unnamed protein product [Moneuplotes crassus]|uniref:EGF-like domain-containing protein n=1 Tax=Euplotes crassus TaxID=5936 RepID=A0AAD1X7W8_EUPCR|nr:unnamed protein product [Moneuplotes crassus]